MYSYVKKKTCDIYLKLIYCERTFVSHVCKFSMHPGDVFSFMVLLHDDFAKLGLAVVTVPQFVFRWTHPSTLLFVNQLQLVTIRNGMACMAWMSMTGTALLSGSAVVSPPKAASTISKSIYLYGTFMVLIRVVSSVQLFSQRTTTTHTPLSAVIITRDNRNNNDDNDTPILHFSSPSKTDPFCIEAQRSFESPLCLCRFGCRFLVLHRRSGLEQEVNVTDHRAETTR
mgnify:CR=1 FL=1